MEVFLTSGAQVKPGRVGERLPGMGWDGMGKLSSSVTSI